MTTYVLIHGAGSDSWYWHLVVPELRAEGHDVVTVDLPCDDDAAGLAEYADVVVDAIGDRSDLVLVAQSLAGFTAPLVCERVPVRMMVLVAAMVPSPGEPPGEWWANTGWEEARRAQAARDSRSTDGDFDAMESFFHDVPPDVTAEAMARGERGQSGRRSRSLGPSPHGPRCRRSSSCAETTASFPRSSNAASYVSVSALPLTR